MVGSHGDLFEKLNRDPDELNDTELARGPACTLRPSGHTSNANGSKAFRETMLDEHWDDVCRDRAQPDP